MARRRSGKQPTLKLLPSLQAPPEAQLANHTAMPATWNDPDDDKPGASRTARQVTGFRGYCPLRRAMQCSNRGSSFVEEHVRAADVLRGLADGACIGFSAPRDAGLPVQSIVYRPRTGPGALAQRQERCWRRFVRVMALFTRPQRALLTEVVLMNRSVNKIVQARQEAGLPTRAAYLMGQLVGVLDLLVEHLRVELERAEAA